MDNRYPIITYFSSDAQMPSQLKSAIERDLPQEGIEWKRPYRRQIKTVYLEARFEDVKALQDQPTQAEATASISADTGQWLQKQLLNTYWIECYDMDHYRGQIRDDLLNWVTRASRDPDTEWLVVLVDHSEKRTAKTKLLPRSSMLDKIRADFPASLKPLLDRHMVMLSDPLKTTESKSIDSFSQLLYRMRNLLLTAYSKQLVNYEEFIRAQREKRTSLHWDFFHFFLAQEELAFAFELLGLFDEALVQYDELDALFSQFVLSAHAQHVPSWLQQLASKCDAWNGLSLSSQSCVHLRTRLKSGRGNLLDLRNYLFARQCELLLLQHKPWEVASRSLQFLQNCVHELQILDVKLLEGAVPCWVYLSAYEILLKCERYNDSSQMDAYSRYTIGIRAYAREKLKELGQLCGLMPGMKPAADYLHHVVILIAGMGEDPHLSPNTPSPQSRLKEALASQDAFLKSYLEFSELTMGTFKHIGRLREARLIGRELSLLYIQMQRNQQALSFLLDMEKMFLAERWPILLTDTRLRILECYEGLGNTFKQLRYLLLLSAATELSEDRRSQYLQRAIMLSESASLTSETLMMRTNELFKMKSIQLLNPKERLNIDSTFHVQIDLYNKLSKSLTVQRVLVILDTTISPKSNQPSVRSTNPCLTFSKLTLNETCESVPNVLTYNAATVGVKCVNVQRVLKRMDSQPAFTLDRDPKVEPFDFAFSADNVELQVGSNSLDLYLTCDESNQFRIKHLLIEWKKGLSFLGDLYQHQIAFDVHLQEPRLELNPVASTNLVAGIEQPIELLFRNGSKALAHPIRCKLTASSGISFVNTSADNYFEYQHNQNLAPLEKFVMSFSVVAEFKDLQKFSILNFDFNCEYSSGAEILSSEDESRSSRALHHLSLTTKFLPPFITVFSMHTCVQQKFIEMLITGSCEHIFELTNARIEFVTNTPHLDIEPLFDSNQSLTVFNGQIAHFVWRLITMDADRAISTSNAEADQLDLQFLVDYDLHPHPTDAGSNESIKMALESGRRRCYTCACSRAHFQTLYEIRAQISPCSKSEFCRVGQLCALLVTIQKTELFALETAAAESLMYELVCDRNLWNVNGRTAGVLNEAEIVEGQLRFEVIPLVSGFLPYPAVRLSRYVCTTDASAVATSSVINSESGVGGPAISTGSIVSDSKIIPFEPGQVYNHSRSRQVNVLPSSSLLSAESST